MKSAGDQNRPHIVLVEPDHLLADMYGAGLAGDYRVTLANSAQAAIDVLDHGSVDALITDVLVGSHNGVEIIHEVRSYDDWLELPIIVLSALPDADFPISRQRWQRYGIKQVLYKPATKPDQLLQAVRTVLEAAPAASEA